MKPEKKKNRLLNFLRQGKALSGEVAWFDDKEGEPGTIMVGLCPAGQNYRVTIEKFLDKNAMCEQLYIVDENRLFESLDEALVYIYDQTEILFEKMHA